MGCKVKICGIKRMDEVDFLNKTEVDYVGFVFARSKRQVTPEIASELIKKLRADILKAGVFTDLPVDDIMRIAEQCRLDIVQLHGAQNDPDIKRFNLPVWKSILVRSPECIQQLELYPSAAAFVLDTFVPGMEGGTGKAFPWDWVSQLSLNHNIVLAGGLNAGNVGQAIEKVNPHVVDVSSGVEGQNGKDEHLVKDFIKAVKGHGNG